MYTANLDWTLMKMVCVFHWRRRKLRNICSFSPSKSRIIAFSSSTRQGQANFVGGGFLRLWKSWNICIWYLSFCQGKLRVFFIFYLKNPNFTLAINDGLCYNDILCPIIRTFNYFLSAVNCKTKCKISKYC